MTGSVRSYAAADRDAVVELFHQTVMLGRPLPFRLAAADEYAELCLGWFLDAEPEKAAVWSDGGEVAGYALVATDLDGLARFQRRGVYRIARALTAGVGKGSSGPESRRFWWGRARDAVRLGRRGGHEPAPVVAHLNLAPSKRAAAAGRRLIEHIDGEARLAGSPIWYGEINAPRGRRAGAMERYGVDVVDREPNLTLSALLDSPVERLVIRRDVDSVVPFH